MSYFKQQLCRKQHLMLYLTSQIFEIKYGEALSKNIFPLILSTASQAVSFFVTKYVFP